MKGQNSLAILSTIMLLLYWFMGTIYDQQLDQSITLKIIYKKSVKHGKTGFIISPSYTTSLLSLVWLLVAEQAALQAEGSSAWFQVLPMEGCTVVMCGWGRLEAGVLWVV